jgi:hypothetical protein
MDDNAIDILLRLQDQLSPALAKAQAALRDAARDMVDTGASGSKSFKDLDESSGSWFATIAGGVAVGDLLASSIKAIASEALDLAKSLPELALRGAAVDDVSEAFERLTSQVGRSSTALLTTLRDGTHGTISDFDLMKRANADLAAGMNLTDGEFSTLSKGAFALAQATGGSVKDALDTMNDAMVTGRAKAVALLTGKVDLKAAEEAFARSLGVTVEELSAEGKLQADRQAILANVGKAVERLGEQTDGLDEKVDQGKAQWRNFLDEIGRTIATSPVVMKAIDDMGGMLEKAFGADRETSIKAVSAAVDGLVIHMVDAGIGAVEATRVIHVAWSGVVTVIDAAATTIVGLVTAIGEVLLAGDKLANKLHLVDDSEVEKIRQTQQYLRDLTSDIAKNTVEAGKGALGMSDFDKSLDAAGGALFGLRDSLETAAAAHVSTTAAAVKHADAQKTLGAATEETTGLTRVSAQQLKAYDELLQHMDKETFTLAMEHEKQWREERLATMARVNTAVLAEFDAQVKLNAEWGLNAAGAVQVQSSALDILNQKLAALHATRIEGISQEKQEQVLLDEYTKALYDEAVAQDTVATSTAKAADSTVSATDKFNSFKNTLVLGVKDLDDVNAALSKFYDDLAAFGGIGSMGGQNGVGTASGGGPSGPRVAGQGLPTRDLGGPVVAGQPYYIGKGAQPELFIPSDAGTMVPNGAGGMTVNLGGVHVTQPFGTPDAIASATLAAVTDRLRQMGVRF